MKSICLVTRLAIVFLLVGIGAAKALPGYYINDEASARRAVQEYANDTAKFRACVYQAELDKSLWRLTLAAHKYKLEHPQSAQAQCSFATAFWRWEEHNLSEKPPAPILEQLNSWTKEAERDSKEAVKKLPDSVPAHLNYGEYLLYFVPGHEKVAPMLAEFKTIVRLQPNLGMAHYWLAEGYFGSGKDDLKTIDLIIQECKTALKLDPRQVQAWFTMAAVYAWPNKADYKSSQKYLDKYLSLYPQGNIGVPPMQKFLKEKLAEKRTLH